MFPYHCKSRKKKENVFYPLQHIASKFPNFQELELKKFFLHTKTKKERKRENERECGNKLKIKKILPDLIRFNLSQINKL